MQHHFLKAKLHRACVTDRSLAYEGSLSVDLELIDQAGLRPFEVIQVYNVNNGARFETYLIEAPRGSRQVCVNGAAARLAENGDRLIIVATCWLTEAELATHRPTIVLLDENNDIVEVTRPKLGESGTQAATTPAPAEARRQ